MSMSGTLSREDALAYLASHHVMVLATTSTNGEPWASPVFYAQDDFNCYFISDHHTRHSTNIDAVPQIAASVFTNATKWQEIKGLQIQGKAYLVDNKRMLKALQVYVKKFNFVKELLVDWSGLFKIGGKMVQSRMYCLEAHRLIYTDNSRGFASKQELVLK